MKSEFRTIAGIKTCFVKQGTGKNKIICLHGWGGSKESWEGLSSQLIKKDTTIIAVDLPGFGESEMPPTSGWNTSQYAKWLEELITKVNWKNPTLIGHSFGCRVIVRFLAKHTDFSGKIVLIGGAGIKWPPGIRQRITIKIKPFVLPFKKVVPKKIWNKVLKKVFGARDWANCPNEIKKTLEKTLKESCIRDILKNIKNETLLLWGKNDGYTPLKSAKVFQENLQNSKLYIFEDGRHGIHRTHTTQCANKITTFLKK